tara:strand:+ start:455 stop:1357 length:903 start_codon:yes stop_codon:yes gene_type:complete
MELDGLLRKKPIKIEGRNNKVFDYSKESESFDFYVDQFEGENDFEIGSGVKNEDLKEAPKEMIETISYLRDNVPKNATIIELGGSKHQRRSGFPYSFFDNYIPLDISLSSMIGYSEIYDKQSIACDAQDLPFKDNVIDVVITHTFLEHPIDPDKVVKEIDRVLKEGGIVIHADAWHCRWWKRYGVFGIIKWTDQTMSQKLLWIVIYLSEIKVFRIPTILLNRIVKTIFQSIKHPINLTFKKLIPNYELKIYSDEDAAASIDPIDLVRFYESRNYNWIYNNSFLKRIFFNQANIFLKKGKP